MARLLKKVTKARKSERLSRVAVICHNQMISLFGGETNFCAFLAIQNGTAVTLPPAHTAARPEFRKLHRSINEGDLCCLKTAGAGT
ncbi:hypothetical protein [Nitrosovibrio sp. Nv6]|uniref:hypothetical protein n=1 Tax=Nitrosovibrio sp. Nv6 TaxID=1855340 RepID=UPI0008BD578C|nr:hypothetical protein [Nitrosovibrio sp. Nv6]SEO73276.1 hypothetical protein SAMN05216316_0929 [Nitrosovibrio sp. Nv6]